MQENKTTILSTRLLRKDSLAEIHTAGLSIEEIPFIETITLTTELLRKQVNEISQKYASVIFTSARAVEAAMDLLGKKETQWRIYCTAPQTKKALLNYFPEEKIAGTAANASELATLIIEERPKTEMIFFCGDQHRDELPQVFKKAETALKQVIVYKTELRPVQLNNDHDGILFFSPSAVKSLFQLNKPKKGTVFFAVGETTATELRAHSGNEILVADHPSEEWMVKKLVERFLVRK
jgi:uroporphyrinogen-III synthase